MAVEIALLGDTENALNLRRQEDGGPVLDDDALDNEAAAEIDETRCDDTERREARHDAHTLRGAPPGPRMGGMKLVALLLAAAVVVACSGSSTPADHDACLQDCCGDPSAPSWCATRAANCHRDDAAAEQNCIDGIERDAPSVTSCFDACE